MSLDVTEALRSLEGTSSLADELVSRLRPARETSDANTMCSESSTVDDDNIGDVLTSLLSDLSNGETSLSSEKLTSVLSLLLATIEGLREENEELKLQIESSSSNLSTEEEVRSFEDSFMASISNRKIGDLRMFYSRNQLQLMRPETRKIVVDCLIQHAYDHNTKPASVWIAVSANNGTL